MAIQKHNTPMLDQLESGPWPSFISGIKRLRDQHPDPRINETINDMLGQLEHSYETRKGYWKGGTVSVFGYGGGIIRAFKLSQGILGGATRARQTHVVLGGLISPAQQKQSGRHKWRGREDQTRGPTNAQALIAHKIIA